MHSPDITTRHLSKPWVAIGAFVILAALTPTGLTAAEAPPDLFLEWLVDGRATVDAPDIIGPAGATVRLKYRIRNIGGTSAFAVVGRAQTALGRVGAPIRIQPGPDAGSHVDRHLDLPLAQGMREICIDVRLQTLAADDPKDPDTDNNRRCRRVTVRREPDVDGIPSRTDARAPWPVTAARATEER